MQQVPIERKEGGRRTRSDRQSERPLVSIITVVFRDRDELENILNNLGAFDNTEYELIVIDGGSQDGTLELLTKRNDQIDYWLSEPDHGIYDAMTKGIRQSRGTFIYHLNAGDRLLYLPIEQLRNADREGLDIVSFRVEINGGKVFTPSRGKLLKYRNTLHHQGTFYRRATFIGYNCEYRIFADFDLNQRMMLSKARIRLYDQVVAFHSVAGISNHTDAGEVFRIIRKNCGIHSVLISFFWFKWTGLAARVSCWKRNQP